MKGSAVKEVTYRKKKLQKENEWTDQGFINIYGKLKTKTKSRKKYNENNEKWISLKQLKQK